MKYTPEQTLKVLNTVILIHNIFWQIALICFIFFNLRYNTWSIQQYIWWTVAAVPIYLTTRIFVSMFSLRIMGVKSDESFNVLLATMQATEDRIKKDIAEDEPKDISPVDIEQSKVLVINKSDRIIGKYKDFEIFDWIEIKMPNSDEIYRLNYNGIMTEIPQLENSSVLFVINEISYYKKL